MTFELDLSTSDAPRSASALFEEFRLYTQQSVRAALRTVPGDRDDEALRPSLAKPQETHVQLAEASPASAAIPLPEMFITDTNANGECKLPEYQKIIDTVAQNLFDPTRLGDINSLRNRFNCEIHTTKEALSSAHEALSIANDPYTDVIDPESLAELGNQMSGHFGGIGVQVGALTRNDDPQAPSEGLVVRGVVAGGPADQAGLQTNDLIVGVDGHEIRSVKLSEGVNFIRGAKDTQAEVTVIRDGKKLSFEIPRAIVDTPVLSDKEVDGFAYIKLNDFLQTNAPKQMEEALKKHQNSDGFIIDLRDNRGGLLENAYLMSSLFMGSGEVVSLKTRLESDPENPRFRESKTYLSSLGFGLEFSKETGDLLPRLTIKNREHDWVDDDKPVVILTNSKTASAAEIFTAALHDHGEATVIGTSTLGKGIGQIIISKGIPGGAAVKVTNLRYYTPNGDWLGDGNNDRKGIVPDIPVGNPIGAAYGSDDDEQLKAAVAFLKSKKKPQTQP